MTIKIQAAHRLHANWFEELSPEEQKKYVEQHPDSKYAEGYDIHKEGQFKTEQKEGDVERIGQLKKQIGYLVQDIKEMSEDGEDVSRERKQLEALRGELAELEH